MVKEIIKVEAEEIVQRRILMYVFTTLCSYDRAGINFETVEV